MINADVNIAVKCSFDSVLIKKLIKEISKNEKKIKGNVEINIVGDAFIKNINKEYRKKNKITDVLSFAWQETDDKFNSSWLGQVFICLPQIKRQSKEYGIFMKEEFSRMLVHSLLHLVGYDHQNDKDEKKMFKKQEDIVVKIKRYYE